MFGNPFRRDPVTRARNFVLSHTGTIVCSLCGEGSNPGIPSALVRVDVVRPGPGRQKRRRAPEPVFYRHMSPRTCDFFMRRAAILKGPLYKRMLSALSAA